MKISVIVPFYNAEKTLAPCIESLLALEEIRCEILVVDNASTDRSFEIAASFEGNSKGKEYRVLKEPKRGREFARNRGAQEATGELLAFTDADCLVDPQWLLPIQEAFLAHPEWAGAGGNIKGAPPKNLVQKFLSLYTLRAHFQKEETLGSFDLFKGGFPGANLVIRKEMFQKLNGFQELPHAAGDFDLCARLYALSGKMGVIPNAVVYHQHRETVKEMCVQAHTTGRAQAVLLRRYFPRDWVVELPGKTVRGKNAPFPIWLNLVYLDKKVLMGLFLAGVWPPLILILLGYLFYLASQAQRHAREENLPLLITEKIGMLGLMLAKSFSMTCGRLQEGVSQKEVCL
jgi:glycosyltransferase involved in cell wall biosynthesis